MALGLPLSVTVWVLVRTITSGAPVWTIGSGGEPGCVGISNIQLSMDALDPYAATVSLKSPTKQWSTTVSAFWTQEEWLHIGVTISSSGVSIYQQGQLFANNVTFSAGALSYGGVFKDLQRTSRWPNSFLGTRDVSATSFFTGYVADVQIYEAALQHADYIYLAQASYYVNGTSVQLADGSPLTIVS